MACCIDDFDLNDSDSDNDELTWEKAVLERDIDDERLERALENWAPSSMCGVVWKTWQ